MAKKKKGKGKKGYKKNPSNPKRGAAKRAARRIGQSIMGLNIRKAIGDVLPTQAGMFAAKWAAKKFPGDSAATEIDPESWNAMSYVKGSIGAFVAGVAANTIKPGSGQAVLAGGINLMIYKAIQNELINKSDWARGQFGADDDVYTPDEYLMTGADEDIALPALFGTDEYPMMFDGNGNAVPATDDYRLPEVEMEGYGDVLEVPGRLGDVLEVPGRLGEDPFTRMYNFRR